MKATGINDATSAKARSLDRLLRGFESVIVAYSGGTDSAYLSLAARAALGPRALAITADSPSYPDHHRRLALDIARDFGFRHEIIQTKEIDDPAYRANPANRCYYCKRELYTQLTALARERGIAVVIDGNNADDRGDYRPGRQAAREFGVRSPLDEVDLTKDEIRALSHAANLPTWDEPASACLSSRIPYHSEVTPAKLRMIEQAERVLRDLGFRVCRVRHHDAVRDAGAPGLSIARLELDPGETPRALEPALRATIDRELQAIGYAEVAIDPRGYRRGSLNEALRLRPV
jgi:uncharacterized protein